MLELEESTHEYEEPAYLSTQCRGADTGHDVWVSMISALYHIIILHEKMIITVYQLSPRQLCHLHQEHWYFILNYHFRNLPYIYSVRGLVIFITIVYYIGGWFLINLARPDIRDYRGLLHWFTVWILNIWVSIIVSQCRVFQTTWKLSIFGWCWGLQRYFYKSLSSRYHKKLILTSQMVQYRWPAQQKSSQPTV